MGTHIKRCEGKGRFENEWTAGKAIETTLKWGGGIYTVVRSISKKKGRKCLKAYMNFRTGFDRHGQPVYGCSVVVTGKGWIVTAFPV